MIEDGTVIRAWVDLHETRLILPTNTASDPLTIDSGLFLTERKLLARMAGRRDNGPDTFEQDLRYLLLPHVFQKGRGLKSVISTETTKRWPKPKPVEELQPTVREYINRSITRYIPSVAITQRMELLARYGVLNTYYTNSPWDMWGYYWDLKLKSDRPLLDPKRIAVVRPSVVGPTASLYFKVAAPAITAPYERSLMVENDPRIIAEAEDYCRGFLVPYKEEEIEALPPNIGLTFRMITRYMREKIVFLTDDPEEDVKNLLSLAS